MSDTATPLTAAVPPLDPREDGEVENPDDFIEEELLVEDVSIDGMCGVY